MSEITKAIRAGIVTNLQTIDGAQLSSGGIQIVPYMIAAASPPVLWVIPGPTRYDETFDRGLDRLTWRVQAVVGVGLEEAAQIVLDELNEPGGPTSVKEAVESDPTLGGGVDDLRVTATSGYLPYVMDAVSTSIGGGRQLISCDWFLDILPLGVD